MSIGLVRFLSIIVLQIPLYGQDNLYIRPSATDALIDGKDSLHFVTINRSINQQNNLLLFFPGTGAVTSDYTKFLNTAANLGFHTIGLSYENDISPEFLCYNSIDTTCFDRARNEIIFGLDEHPVVNVDEKNSIYQRAVKLLKYLDIEYPLDNWGQFLDDQDSIVWSKVRVAGHSQGGNHAGFISKLFAVKRCLIFSSRDWMGFYQEPAKWVQRPSLTDSSAYFGLVHRLDTNAYGLNGEILINWSYFNMDGFGSIVSVDTLPMPFLGRHMLTSNLPQPQGNTIHHYYHRTVIGNNDTPLDSNNTPVYKAVWEYMIDGDADSSIHGLAELQKNEMHGYPNPTMGKFYIKSSSCTGDYKIKVFTLQGDLIREDANAFYIDLSEFRNGMYIIHLICENGTMATSKIIKW